MGNQSLGHELCLCLPKDTGRYEEAAERTSESGVVDAVPLGGMTQSPWPSGLPFGISGWNCPGIYEG